MSWQRTIAALTLSMEARGEPKPGQIAVAWSFRNRLESGRWGSSLASVCLWHGAYSGWWSPRQADGKPYRDPNFAYATGLQDGDPMLVSMLAIIDSVMADLSQNDPTDGSTHYFSTDIGAPDWVAGATFTVQIGKHRFYKGVA